ncbi:alpha/beta hydrolase [Streptomyces sp. 8P21H-1]|nr:alpha/beta hydrolase [Streptomyces sp. 8P21H-1]NSL43330.1 alpha/beta hydrolase [Streptomyces sp. 8P21H-1]
MSDETPLPDGFESITVSVNGTRLHAVVGGSGEPVLLLHGWPQTWRAWRYLMPTLAEHGYRVIAPDLRGIGASDRPLSGYDKDTQAEDMRELLAQLGIHGGVRIIGHDIGGMVAFAYARRHPEGVERLVLVELALPGLGLEQAMDVASGGLFHFGLFMTEELPELLLDGRESDFLTWWFNWLSAVPGTFPPKEVAAVASSYRGYEALRAGFAHYRTLLDDGRTNRTWRETGGILPMPVLAVGGEHSTGTQLADSLNTVAQRLAGVVIPGSGHFVPEECPDAFARELLHFLSAPPRPDCSSPTPPSTGSAACHGVRSGSTTTTVRGPITAWRSGG